MRLRTPGSPKLVLKCGSVSRDRKKCKVGNERAKEAANRALGLDANLAEAHEALAAVYRSSEFNWEQTIVESDRTLLLNPNLEQPHYYRAAAFYHLGLLGVD